MIEDKFHQENQEEKERDLRGWGWGGIRGCLAKEGEKRVCLFVCLFVNSSQFVFCQHRKCSGVEIWTLCLLF